MPASVSVASLTSSMGWNDALGLTSATGPNGDTSSTSYGVSTFIGRPEWKQLPSGIYVRYEYGQNTVTEKVVTTNAPGQTPLRWTRTTLDGFGRPVTVENGTGATTNAAVSVVETVYEPCACTPIGKMKRTSRPYAPSAPNAPPPTKYWTEYTYDALGRTVSVRAPDGASTTQYVYEGASVKTIDAKGKWKKFVKDAVGNLVTVWEPSPAGGADLETTYSYDSFDRLNAVTKLRGTTNQTRTFSYGVMGLNSKIEPETGSTTYYYRSDGRLDFQLDAKGQKIQQVYEDDFVLGPTKRLVQIRKYPNAGNEDVCQRIEMYYAGAVPPGGDQGVSVYASGRLSGVVYKGQNCGQTFCGAVFLTKICGLELGVSVNIAAKLQEKCG